MKTLLAGLVALTLVLAGSAQALAVEASEAPGAKPLAVGTTFPDVPLVGNLSPELAASLGIAQAGPTPINKIDADVLVVEIFSMYCPFCQREAPNINQLQSLIDKQNLGGRIKIIGIGAGNSDTEVEIFRKKYNVPFALFSDSSFAVHQRIGQVGTPFFYVLRKKPAGYEIVHTHLGLIHSPTEFLAAVTAKAGL
ncbi:MAG: peroxiredoxin family protein [Acidobacteriota bacterium]